MRGRILLTGATGFIGRAVLERLASLADLRVRLLLHKNVPELLLPRHIDTVHADLARPETLNKSCADIETVLHLAGYIGDDQELCETVNALGTEELVQRAREAGARRFVYLSNAAVYGYGVHRHAKETEVTVHPATFISRSRVRAEQAVLRRDGIVLRPLFVYGRGDTYFLPVIIRALDQFPFMISGGRARLSVISGDDLAAVLVALVTDDWTERHRGIFHVNDRHPVSFRDIAVSLARCVGSRLPSFSVPFFLARAILSLSGKRIFKKAGQRSLRHRLFLISKDHFYDSSKLWDLVSAKPGPPFPERLPQYADWYRRFVAGEKHEGAA